MRIKSILRNLDKKFENRKNFKIIIGIGFIFLGVIGGFTPILQGWIFILIGGYLLFGEKFITFFKKFKKK
ncbi:MAG TPA: hypothetical protein VJH65_00095 [Candidatus Nanoarchaeia archaeon]|nr:hypothetical protein [Candidatus Nanoarchaeia archaeon]